MAKPSSSPGVGGSVTREDLIGLMASCTQTGSQIGEIRGELGAKFSKLEERGLNSKVFKAIRSLTRGRNAAGITAMVKCFNEYCEKLGFNDQGDIEDFIKSQPDTRTAHERAMDGELDPAAAGKGEGSTVSTVTDHPKKAETEALTTFKAAIAEAETPDDVNDGLERFQADYPDLTDKAMEIASERLTELAEAASLPAG